MKVHRRLGIYQVLSHRLIKHMIGVQVVRNLHEAKNMALKAEFMMQDLGRYEHVRRNVGGENSRTTGDDEVTVPEVQPRSDRYKEEKATRKQKVVEAKETPKVANPYAKPAPVKCFKVGGENSRTTRLSS